MKKSVFVLLILAGWGSFAGNEANPDAVVVKPLPLPAKFESDMDHPLVFDRSRRFVVAVASAAEREVSVAWANRHLSIWFPVTSPVAVSAPADPVAGGEEAYAIRADEAGIRISANGFRGVRLALYTLRQLVIAKRGTLKTEGYLVPRLNIEDRPAMAFRALHLCWFPETKPLQIERAIRLAALLKYNYVIIEPWGTYESAKYPWFGWATEKTMTKREIRRLVEIGRDLGVTLVPQLNVFGHATLAGTSSLKHAVLDLTPEYEPLFEPGGWNWCLSNPEAQKVLRELVAELHEDFGRPPFFHLGCDEAQTPSCPECRRRPYGEMFCEHVLAMVEYVRGLGARSMMWHDMMLRGEDPRWQGFYAFGSESTVKLLDRLPKDVIICDWQYKRPNDLDKSKWPTLEHLIGHGNTVVACPWRNYDSVAEQGRYIAEHGGFGFVQTTWGYLFGMDWTKMFSAGAAVSWSLNLDQSTNAHGGFPLFNSRFANLMRMAGRDAAVKDYVDTGTFNRQIEPETNWHRN